MYASTKFERQNYQAGSSVKRDCGHSGGVDAECEDSSYTSGI